jgi:hypothetical protein
MPKVNFDSKAPTLDTVVTDGGLIVNGNKTFMLTSYIPNTNTFDGDLENPLLGFIDLSTGELIQTGIPLPATINRLGRSGVFSSSFDYIPSDDYTLDIKKV